VLGGRWLRLLEGGGGQAAGESGAPAASWEERRPDWRVEAGRRLAAAAGGCRRAGGWGERRAGSELGRAAARLERGQHGDWGRESASRGVIVSA
jgi:hypothetical protein